MNALNIFSQFANLASNAVLLTDMEGVVVAANLSLQDLLGKPVRETVGQRLDDLTTDPPKKTGEYLKQCRGSREGNLGTLSFAHKDGETTKVSCSGALIQLSLESETKFIQLHLTETAEKNKGFSELNDKITQLEKQIRERLRAEAELLKLQQELEQKVSDRTQALSESNQLLEEEMAQRETVQKERESLHRQLLDASRLAGMAEVASGVLHNVGNVLNNVNVSASVISDKLKKSKSNDLQQVLSVAKEHGNDLASFIADHRQGKLMIPYLFKLSDHLAQDEASLSEEIQNLVDNLEHVKHIISMQQEYAHASEILEPVEVTDLIDDALRMSGSSFLKNRVAVDRKIDDLPTLKIYRHKVLQILVNLVKNALEAMKASGNIQKTLTLSASRSADNRLQIEIQDNGIGIAAGDLVHIFNYGFTTKKHGRGVGLHHGSNTACEMEGQLTASSGGLQQGATFTLVLPFIEAEERVLV